MKFARLVFGVLFFGVVTVATEVAEPPGLAAAAINPAPDLCRGNRHLQAVRWPAGGSPLPAA